MERLEFPKGFLWGSATAGYQIEGGNKNDWSEWETSEKRLKDLEKRGLIKKYGKENFICGNATGHYKMFNKDFSLAKELGHSAFRLSIEWSRIEPREGEWDKKEIQHYRTEIQTLKNLGVEPFVTLWHWPVPLWVKKQGGWTSRKTAHDFARYAEKIVKEIPEITFFITLNEPEVYTGMSYFAGVWPPQKKNPITGLRVFHNLIKGHKLAYTRIKNIFPEAHIGIAKHNTFFEPERNLCINKCIVKIRSWAWNRYFLNRINAYQDFIGLNHYFHERIHLLKKINENKKVSDMGWELYPESIFHVLKELKKYKKPIYITENGLADAKDIHRPWFIWETLTWVHKAIQEGTDVRGYLHWSFIDNFEWADGFWPRFGLVEVDYKTLERKPRPSALLYRDIIRANALTPEIKEIYIHLFKKSDN